MKKEIFVVIIFIISCVQRIYGIDPSYEIKALEGTYFYGTQYDKKSYPYSFGGIILEADSTVINIDDDETFYKSLFRQAELTQEGFEFYANVLNIMYSKQTSNNYDIAWKFNMELIEMCKSSEKTDCFRLKSGPNVDLHYVRMKGLFFSITNESLCNQFTTSLDIDKNLLPKSSYVNILIPIVVFECTESNHTFIIQ